MFEEMLAEPLSDAQLAAARLSAPEKARVVAHYERAAALMEANFPGVPLAAAFHPSGLGTPATFECVWHDAIPTTMTAVEMTVRGQARGISG